MRPLSNSSATETIIISPVVLNALTSDVIIISLGTALKAKLGIKAIIARKNALKSVILLEILLR